MATMMRDEEETFAPLPEDEDAASAFSTLPMLADASGLGVRMGDSGIAKPRSRGSVGLKSPSDMITTDFDALLAGIRDTKAAPVPDVSGLTAGGDDDEGLGGPRDNAPGGKVVRSRVSLAAPSWSMPGAEADADAKRREVDPGPRAPGTVTGTGVRMGAGGLTDAGKQRVSLGGLSSGDDDGAGGDAPAKPTVTPAVASAAAAPEKPSTLKAFFGDTDEPNLSWIARRGAEFNEVGSNRKPNTSVADEMDARYEKKQADKKAAAGMDRQRMLDASLMRLRELQGKAAESRAQAAGQPKPVAIDPLLEDKRALLQKQGALADARAKAALRGRPVASGGARSGGDSGFTEDDADIAAKLYLSGNKFPLGRDPTGEKAAMVLRSIDRLAKENGVDPARAIADAKAYMKTLNTLTTTNAVLAGQEGSIKGHFDILKNASGKVPRSISPLLNEGILYAKSHFAGDPDTTNLLNAIDTSTSEYAQYMTPKGSTTDATKAKAERMIAKGISDGALAAVAAQMKQEIDAKKASMGAAREDVAGRIKTVGGGGTAALGDKVKVRDPKSGRTASVAAADVEKALNDPESRIFGWEQVK